ncbi:hypothetical protein [Spongiibacter marinus]|uniref:hypothetical protein n=1 Tax=Spongiibacter marinus TaxID=354246 RepID=UPI00356AFFA6
MENTKVKINLKTGEIEFEGSEEFVQHQMDSLDSIIDLLSSSVVSGTSPESNQSSISNEVEELSENEIAQESSNHNGDSLAVPESFGEWMHRFKDSINDIEKALVTAFYVQNQSDKNDFKTLEVNKSLRDHGIKLSNPSRSLKLLEEKKYLFQTRKEGQKVRFMRVSQDGMSHLKSLLR